MKLSKKQTSRPGHIVIGLVVIIIVVALLVAIKPELFKQFRFNTGSGSPGLPSLSSPSYETDAPSQNNADYKMVTMDGQRYMAIKTNSGQWQFYGPIKPQE